MKLTASDFDKLKTFYRDEQQLSFRPGKRLFAWLEAHFDIRVINNVVKMDVATKKQIRELLEHENRGLNLKAGLPEQANRIEMAAVMQNEKLAAVKPDENYVLVKGYSGGVILKTGEVDVPESISLRVPVQQLQIEFYDIILVVENLDVFDALPDYEIPLKGKILLVYRGHDKGTSKGLKKLLELAQPHCNICWFPDLDPKGLEMAFAESAVSHILSVDVDTDLAQLREISNPELYLKQHKAASHLKTSLSSTHPLVNHMLQYQLAVMQQHLLRHQRPLKIYST